MKKTTLIALMMALVATPCFAQEIEPDGLFSLEGTLWWYFRPEINFRIYPPPPFFDGINVSSEELGFYEGIPYKCRSGTCSDYGNHGIYINTPVLGIYSLLPSPFPGLELFIMQPTAGIGLTTFFVCGGVKGYSSCQFGIRIMIKINNNWSPPGVEPPTE